MANAKRLDMTQGPILKKMLIFVIPAILTSLIQQLYTIADRVVVGRFAENGTVALAAVGSTGSASAMFLNIFISERESHPAKAPEAIASTARPL